MISVCWEWKKEIKQELEEFELYIIENYDGTTNIWNDSQSIPAEKFFFFTALAIRKLYESHYLSNGLLALKIPVHKFPRLDFCRKKELSISIRSIYFYHLYDFENGCKEYIDIIKLCHLFIHSHVLAVDWNNIYPRRCIINGVFINSDRTQSSYVNLIGIDDYISLLRCVICDNS